ADEPEPSALLPARDPADRQRRFASVGPRRLLRAFAGPIAALLLAAEPEAQRRPARRQRHGGPGNADEAEADRSERRLEAEPGQIADPVDEHVDQGLRLVLLRGRYDAEQRLAGRPRYRVAGRAMQRGEDHHDAVERPDREH